MANNQREDDAKSDIKRRIAKEEKKLTEVMRDVPEDQVKTVDGLIKRAAFMRIQLENYEKDLNENGFVEMFAQDEKQEPYERERPAARLHTQAVKVYAQVMRMLLDLVPSKPGTNTDPAYNEFFAS
ncbi:hypothetical protein AGMMS49992_24280 [Clostridia bacterium]|nr:hypothetical protein AGMMS49992_24280 [Clostridia bacterium]